MNRLVGYHSYKLHILESVGTWPKDNEVALVVVMIIYCLEQLEIIYVIIIKQ